MRSSKISSSRSEIFRALMYSPPRLSLDEGAERDVGARCRIRDATALRDPDDDGLMSKAHPRIRSPAVKVSPGRIYDTSLDRLHECCLAGMVSMGCAVPMAEGTGTLRHDRAALLGYRGRPHSGRLICLDGQGTIEPTYVSTFGVSPTPNRERPACQGLRRGKGEQILG